MQLFWISSSVSFVFFWSKRRGRPRKHPLPPRPSLPSPSSSSSSSTSSASSSSGSSSSSSEDDDDDDDDGGMATVGAMEPCAAPRCRLPQQDTVQWIQCDVCDAWYHIDCLHVDRKKLLKDPNADFHCGCRWRSRPKRLLRAFLSINVYFIRTEEKLVQTKAQGGVWFTCEAAAGWRPCTSAVVNSAPLRLQRQTDETPPPGDHDDQKAFTADHGAAFRLMRRLQTGRASSPPWALCLQLPLLTAPARVSLLQEPEASRRVTLSGRWSNVWKHFCRSSCGTLGGFIFY